MENKERHIKNFQSLVDMAFKITVNGFGKALTEETKEYTINVIDFKLYEIYLEIYFRDKEQVNTPTRISSYIYRIEDWIWYLIGKRYSVRVAKIKSIDE
jgi:hypothetical protein